MTLALTDERLREIIRDREYSARTSANHTSERRELEIAALARAVIEAREALVVAGIHRTALATVEPGESALLQKLRDVLGGTGA